MRHFQVIWLVCFLWSFTSQAQFVFQNLREEDGLSAKDVRCLYKDPDGFLWIGTANGLNRFDGNTIKYYDDLRTDHHVEVKCILPIDGNHNLLVATSHGLKLFNKATSKYRADQRWKSLAGKLILSVKEDGEHRLWFICRSEIFIYDGAKMWKLTELLPWAERMAGQDVSFAAESAFCWDASRQGFWVGGNQCFFIDFRNKAVYDSTYNPHRWPILNTKWVTAIALDKDANLWYSTSAGFSLHFSKPDVASDTSYLYLDNVRSTDGANYLFVDSQNRLWISTWMYAAYMKEPGKPIRKLFYSQDDAFSIGYGFFYHIIEDDEKDLWFATLNGLSKLTYNNPFETVYRLPSRPFFLQVNFASNNTLAAREIPFSRRRKTALCSLQKEKRFSNNTLHPRKYF